MKITRKPVKAFIECPLCECEFLLAGRDWKEVEMNRYTDNITGTYGVNCPNCRHFIKIVPGEVKCKK